MQWFLTSFVFDLKFHTVFAKKFEKSIFAKISRTSLARRILVFNFIPFGFSERTGKTKTTSARDYF